MRAKFGLIVGLVTFVATVPGIALLGGGEVYNAKPLNLFDTAASSDGPAQSIRTVLSGQQTAWNRGDIPAFLEGYWNSPELTFAGSDGIVRGYDGFLPDTGRATRTGKAWASWTFQAWRSGRWGRQPRLCWVNGT
jgi:hypothetical protein